MALKAVGADIALKRNDANGKFDLDWDTTTSLGNKGNPKFDDTRTHSVMAVLVSRKRGKRPGSSVEENGYYWDLDGRFGTLLWSVVFDRSSTPSDLSAYANDGGQQLIDTKKIQSFQVVQAKRTQPSRWRLDVRWTTPAGEQNGTVNL